jgi:hypothetical protein
MSDARKFGRGASGGRIPAVSSRVTSGAYGFGWTGFDGGGFGRSVGRPVSVPGFGCDPAPARYIAYSLLLFAVIKHITRAVR